MAREARQSGKRPAFFEDLPTPSRAPKSAKVYIEKHNTPNGSCVVELNAYDKMNAQQERLRDPNAPLIGTLGRGKRKASPTMNAKEREQATNVEQRGRIRAQRRLDGKMEGAQPKQPKQYACRFRRRPGESEPNHFDRVMGEFGEVAERQNRLRERDLDLNDTARREDHSTAPNRCWPPPRPGNESGTTNLQRLRGYYDILDSMKDKIKTCSNCLQKGCNLGVGDGASGSDEETMCWFCREKPEVLHYKNGLDLNVSRDAIQGVETDTSNQEREELARIVSRWGELSPVEEAMISPVSACFSILKLPSGGQLGYRGNVINFAFDVGKVRKCTPTHVQNTP